MAGNAVTGHAQTITDNAVVTVDGPAAGAPASGEYGRWTASGIEGRSKAEHLSDLNVADGATAYADADAKAAAVQSGAITNAVTKAPTHDAVFDVKATADGAIAKTLLTTRGDIIYRNASVPARLAKGTNGHVLTMGANDPAWTAPAAATKEFFALVTYGTEIGRWDKFPVAICNGDGEHAFVGFFIPADFSSITDVVGVLQPRQTHANAGIDIFSAYGADGQAYNAHSENDTASTYNITTNQIYELDLSGILSSLAAGDYVGVQFILTGGSAGDFNLMGIRFKYS